MENISLEQMLQELTRSILLQGPRATYYYKRENFETGADEYVEITSVDLCDSRFTTQDGDFSEFEWELKTSRIYKVVTK